MSAIIQLMNSCSINDISGSLNTYYGDYDTLHYSLQILDGTVQSWELESEELIESIREDLEHPSHYEDIDEEYIRDAGGIIGHFLKTYIQTEDDESYHGIEEMKKRFKENDTISPLEDNLSILNYLLISNNNTITSINVGDVFLHIMRSSKEAFQQAFSSIRKTLELFMRNSFYLWIEERAKVLLLMTQHKNFIINTPLSIIKYFLDMMLTELLPFENVGSDEVNTQILQNIHEIYVEFMNNSEIVLAITSVNMVTQLHILLRYSETELYLKNLIMEILTIVCAHNDQASKALLENGIHSTLDRIDQNLNYKSETIKIPIVSLIWALLPPHFQCSLLDKVRDVTLRTDVNKMAVWSMETTPGTWIPFIPPFNYLVEKSYREKKTEVLCNDLNVIFTVDFNHMAIIYEKTSERMAISRHEIDSYRALNLKKTKKGSDVPHINDKFVKLAYTLLTRRFTISLYHQEQFYCLEALMTLMKYINRTQYQLVLFPEKPSINVWRADQTVKIMKSLLIQEQMYRKMFALQILYVLKENHEELYNESYKIYGVNIFLLNISDEIEISDNSRRDAEKSLLDIEFEVWMKDQIRAYLSDFDVQIDVYPKFTERISDYFDVKVTRDELEYYKTLFFDEKYSNLIQRRSEAIKFFLDYLTEPVIIHLQLERMRMFLQVFTGRPMENTFQNFEIVRETLKELVEKVGYFLAANENNEKKDFSKIYTTSLYTIGGLNCRHYDIVICDSETNKKRPLTVRPFTIIQHLEFYAFAESNPGQYNGWSRHSNHKFLYEFRLTMNDKHVPPEITVHEAICRYALRGNEKNIFQRKYKFTYFKKQRFTPMDNPLLDCRNRQLLHCLRYRRPADKCLNLTEDVTNALHLTDVLYGINKYWSLAYNPIETEEYIINPQVFINKSLDALVTSCLMDPFAVLVGKLPPWIKYVMNNCPFIFSLKTRIFAFRLLKLDRARAFLTVMDRNMEYVPYFDQSMVVYNAPLSFKIRRTNVLENLIQVISYTNPAAFWSVNFEGEIGTGPGLTRELFTLISRELQKTKYHIWASQESTDTSSEYVQCNLRLYPLFNSHSYYRFRTAEDNFLCDLFNLIGVLLGRALISGNLMVLPLAPTMFKWLLNEQSTLSVEDLKYVNYEVYTVLRNMQHLISERDKIVANEQLTLKQTELLKDKLNINGYSIESYGLNFVLPGFDNIELIPNGRDIPVSLQNMDDYIENVKHALLYTGTRRQFNALKNAFDSLVPLHKLRMFHPEELQTLLCGDDNDIMQWTVENLRKNVKLEGFTVEDDDIQNLFSELSDASKESRSNFLEFVTGCTRLPVGGFEDLQPPLRIVRTTAGWPSAQTCYHQLNLPSGMTKEQISKFMIEIVPEALGFFGLA